MMRLVLRLYREVPAFCQRVTAGPAMWSLASVRCLELNSGCFICLKSLRVSCALVLVSNLDVHVARFACNLVHAWLAFTFAQIVFYLQRANAKFGGQKEWQQAVAASDNTLRKHFAELAQSPSDPVNCSLSAARTAPIWMRSVVQGLSDLVESLQVTEANLEAWHAAQEVGCCNSVIWCYEFLCYVCPDVVDSAI